MANKDHGDNVYDKENKEEKDINAYEKGVRRGATILRAHASAQKSGP